MKNELIQKIQLTQQKFEKYPKNYQENHHYRSVKQKLMTAEDDQDIIKFPFTTSIESRKPSKGTSPPTAKRKVQKYKGKKFQTIPMRTISYSTPLNYQKKEQFSRSAKTSHKLQEENKFASKNLFTNMKKLKDLRKTNYKNRITSMQRNQNPQKTTESNQINLDLFKLTSTNFHYKERVSSDGNEESELLRKLNQTQQASRNVIKFHKQTKSKQSNPIDKINKTGEEFREKTVKQEHFFVLHPVKTEQTNSVQKARQKSLIQTKSTKNFQSNRFSDGAVQNLIEDESSANFVRYSETTIDPQHEVLRSGTIDPQHEVLRSGITKLKEINNSKNDKNFKRSELEHIPHSFRASFRVKHIDDNKNILLNTIKRKASIMERNQLVQYLRKVVK